MSGEPVTSVACTARSRLACHQVFGDIGSLMGHCRLDHNRGPWVNPLPIRVLDFLLVEQEVQWAKPVQPAQSTPARQPVNWAPDQQYWAIQVHKCDECKWRFESQSMLEEHHRRAHSFGNRSSARSLTAKNGFAEQNHFDATRQGTTPVFTGSTVRLRDVTRVSI